MIACVLEVACVASIALRWIMVDALKFCVILTIPFGAIDKTHCTLPRLTPYGLENGQSSFADHRQLPIADVDARN
jgi:hypothetical protein